MVNHARLCQEMGSSSQTPTGKQKEVWPKVKLSAHASHREPLEGLNLLISSNSRDNTAADATVCRQRCRNDVAIRLMYDLAHGC